MVAGGVVGIFGVQLGALLDQQFHNRLVPVHRCPRQHCSTIAVFGV